LATSHRLVKQGRRIHGGDVGSAAASTTGGCSVQRHRCGYRIGVKLKEPLCHQCQTLCRTRQGGRELLILAPIDGLVRPKAVPVRSDLCEDAAAMLNTHVTTSHPAMMLQGGTVRLHPMRLWLWLHLVLGRPHAGGAGRPVCHGMQVGRHHLSRHCTGKPSPPLRCTVSCVTHIPYLTRHNI
jgi:hypothetical protein